MFGQGNILHISKKACLKNQFSSILNKNLFSKKLKPKEPLTQVGIKSHSVESNLPVEKVGWAGQPIVQRVHPILPELPGDIADTLKTVKLMSKQQEIFPVSVQGSEEVSAKTDILSIESVPVEQSMESAEKIMMEIKANQARPEDNVLPEEVKNRVRSHDTISLLNEDVKKLNSKDTDNSLLKPTTMESTNVDPKQGKHKIDKPIKKFVQKDLPKRPVKPKYTVKRVKKIRKKTKVMPSNENPKMNFNENKKVSQSTSGIKFMNLSLNKKPSLNSQFLLNQRGYTLNAIPKGFLLMENRQFGTDCKFPPCAEKSKGDSTSKSACAFPPCGKPGIRGKVSKKVKQDGEGKYPDDCKCPTMAESKFRMDTKICGEAKGAGKKKDAKKRKMKMCLVENKIKHRIRTFVCKSAAFERGRKKKNLPKCPPPEKKVAARALICPPILEDEEAKAKVKCVKQVEEIKVRARTKVCKPIIIHAKEEVSLKIEKAECVEKKAKLVVSRHTSICLPSNPKEKITLLSTR